MSFRHITNKSIKDRADALPIIQGVMCTMELDRARIRVDFNEMVEEDLVLLSKTDEVSDSGGSTIVLVEGLSLSVYEFNEYENGEKELLLADGVVELNALETNGEWTSEAKWCLRVDQNGIRNHGT